MSCFNVSKFKFSCIEKFRFRPFRLITLQQNGGDDNEAAMSKHRFGRINPAMEMCFELDICPDLLLAAVAAAGAAFFFFLYMAITARGRRKRRRKRHDDNESHIAFDWLQLGKFA